MVKVGCCGFPVAREAYFRRFSIVEINDTFYNLPRLSTVERWRQEAPADFEFSLKAWQLITHQSSSPTYAKLRSDLGPKRLARCGHFRDSDEVREAWAKTEEMARELRPRFILFQTAASFYPNADHLRDMYRFFKGTKRAGALLAWEPRGPWEDGLVRKVCEDLGLVHVVDPAARESQRAPVRYWRLHGRMDRGRIHYQHEFSDAELKALAARCEGKPAYVFFNNSAMWRDAQRFAALLNLPTPVAAIRPGTRRRGRTQFLSDRGTLGLRPGTGRRTIY